jgi:hypothetical protein
MTRKADAKRKKLGNCIQPGCPNAAYYTGAKLCTACYSFHHYWTGRSVTDKVKRAEKLQFWAIRAEDVLMPQKVTNIRKKAPAKRRA